MASTDTEQVTVKVRRSKLATRRGETWTYDYTTPVDIKLGGLPARTVPAGTYVGFGTGIGELRDMLRRTYGRGVEIVETWK